MTTEKKDWRYYNKIDPSYEKEGHFRIVPNTEEQLQFLFNHKYIYCVEENFIYFCETNGIEVDYDYPDAKTKMIPLSICGIRGNEFEEWIGEKAMKVSGNMIKLINGEEQEILLGHLKGDGSEILYS